MKKRLFPLALSVLCMMIFPVFAEAEGAPSVLRIASDAARPGTFDPHFAASDPDRMLADILFNGLVRYKPGNAPLIEPDLAESIPEPEIIEGGKQIWTFKLREGVMFHSGPRTESYELKADDVIFSLRKSADPERSAYSGEYAGMTFEKVNRYTVRIILEKPISSILFLPKVSDYAGGFIVSKKVFEAGYPDGFFLRITSSELLTYLLPYQSLKNQLARISFDLETSIVDHPTMHKLIRQDENPIILYGAWRPNADVYLTRFFHSDSIVITGAKPDTNFSHYDKLDDLIEAARIEIDPSTQIELWRHAQIMILQDMVAYPLHYLNQIFARRNYVDYGHEVVSSMALYPRITEKTRIRN